MGTMRLTVAETQNMFVYISENIEKSKDLLTEADKAIGGEIN
jgi:hypothetical protein